MKTPDEKLQELIEQGRHEGQDSDSMAYKIIFQAIKKDPVHELSSTFTDEVINRITQLREQRALRKDFGWLVFGLLVFLIAAIVTIVLVDFKFDPGVFKFLSNYGGLLLFGAILVVALHWIEKQILPRKQLSN